VSRLVSRTPVVESTDSPGARIDVSPSAEPETLASESSPATGTDELVDSFLISSEIASNVKGLLSDASISAATAVDISSKAESSKRESLPGSTFI